MGIALQYKSISGELVCLWLPKKYVKAGTSEYVQGVECFEEVIEQV